MRSIENETRLTMNERRNFVNYATMTLSDGTVLNLTPSDFRISGQSFTDDWSDGEAFQVGTAIGKTATLLLDNTDGREEEIGSSIVRYPHGKFSQYDFYMAYFQLFVCLPDAYTYGSSIRDQMIPIGTFTVTTPVANSSTIEITGVDNMYMFDKPFDDVGLDFSVSTGWSLKEILNAVCTYCGVAIGYTTFDNETIRIYEKPDNVTCRQVVSYIAQIAGCNAVISTTGALTLKWYNTSAFTSWLDGGTFTWDTTERQYQNTITWTTAYHWLGWRITFNAASYGDLRDDITEPGIYKLNIKITDIVDPSNFDASYRIQESTDNGTTFTTTQTGPLASGDNRIDYLFNISREDHIIYRVQCGQDNTDPNASKFDATFFITMYSNGDVADGGYFDSGSPTYTSGDSYDGGDFTTPLPFHNLKNIKATQVSTDDIHFTGVNIKNGEVEVHYPSSTDWNTYALEISDNPFVKDNESIIALFLYNRLKNLIIRPFTCSSLQDPTIEAGDAALVYDVKGNTYFTVITNVTFTTGSYTEISCKAETPIKQNSRYANSQGVIQLERRTDDYNKQVAHFNEIANAALGYYKTTEVDSQTGAVTTYLHDQPTLELSTDIVKIASGIIAISDDGGNSWNKGLDISTGTLLLNLVYVHGLTSDWIRTGTLDVGGLNNEDGIIRVTNRNNAGSSVTMTGTNTYIYMYIGPSQIDISGTYKVFYNIYDFESGKPQKVWCKIQKRDKWDGTTYTWQVVQDWYVVTDFTGELPLLFDVDTTDGDMYYYIQFSRNSTDNALFSGALFYNKINTVIDNRGIETSNIKIKGGALTGATSFELTSGSSNPQNDSTLNWGGSWQDSLTVLVNANYDGGLGVAHSSDISRWAVYMHYDDIRLYSNSYNPLYAQWGSSSSSDRRLKTNVRPLSSEILQKFYAKLNPIIFNYKEELHEEGTYFGVFAQDVEEALTEIDIEDSRIVYEDVKGYKNLSYCSMIGIQIGAVKDLYAIVNEQQAQIDALKQRIEQLESIVNTK